MITARNAIAVLGTAMCLAAAGVGAAHELSGPTTVVADENGHFAYELTLVVTQAVEYAYTEQDGSDNTDLGHWIGDGFCLYTIEAGTYTNTVEGNLLVPADNGTVIHTEALCDGWTETVTTTIIAPDVAAEPLSWSTIKIRYR